MKYEKEFIREYISDVMSLDNQDLDNAMCCAFEALDLDDLTWDDLLKIVRS